MTEGSPDDVDRTQAFAPPTEEFAPPTTEFPAPTEPLAYTEPQYTQPQYTQPMMTPPQYPAPSYPAPSTAPKRGNGLLIGLLAGVLLLGLAAGAYFLLTSSGADSAQPPVTVTESVTASLATPPADSTPCDETVGVGTSVTSCPFAAAVRNAYLAAGSKGEARTVTAGSPVTGQTYTMNCTPERGIVVCRGGNDAVVHIY
ncbi:MAG: hypothetical protein QM728_03655 [Gordonia sp. (in: high G+C Gram-positive bacteria)]|uniref:hypothetical protein n=1 Tax=Gordonia sp. (in: high G+C Gram-positive bacteria) TaxID=84139 RepID=UPI0039E49AFE